jgi:hypothetical protein
MPATLQRTTYRLACRLCRRAVLLLLVLAQAATAFGFPVVQSRSGRPGPCGSGACGCDSVCGTLDGCCCTTGIPAPPQPVAPSCGRCGGEPGSCCCDDEPEPEPAACPKCRTKQKSPEPAAPTTVSLPKLKWVLGWKARQCRGDGPLGLFADLPAVPPAVPARPAFAPLPAGTVCVIDSLVLSLSSVPDEPPPRCG